MFFAIKAINSLLLIKQICSFHIPYARLGSWSPARRSFSASCLTPTTPSESVRTCCEIVVAAQPEALIIPYGRKEAEFSGWRGVIKVLDEFSQSRMLPFVDRVETLTRTTKALLENELSARKISSMFGAVESRSLQLVGSGALHGAGKTRLSPVLYQCLKRAIEEQCEQKVVYCVIHNWENDTSPMSFWKMIMTSNPDMQALLSKIPVDQHTSWKRLWSSISAQLAAEKSKLFLHLDEFVPFNEQGQLENTKSNFYNCWQDMLMPVLETPKMFLFLSGRLPYFDSIGSELSHQPPCNALPVQLDLFDVNAVHDILSKTSIPLPLSVDAESPTITLAKALDSIMPATGAGEGAAWSVARRLHELTGGVPRFIEHAIHALLKDPVVNSALFHGSHHGDLDQHIDSMFRKGGALYRAVRKEAQNHFSAALGRTTNLLQDGDRARDVHVAGLLSIVLLQGRACRISKVDLQHWLSRDSFYTPLLLREAQYWGFYRDLNQTESTVKIPVSDAVFAGLKPVLSKFVQEFPMSINKKHLMTEEQDLTGQAAKRAVGLALIFHRIMAGIIEDHTWLKRDQSTALAPVDASLLSAGQGNNWPGGAVLELPRLPRVDGRGKMKSVDDVSKIAHNIRDIGDAGDAVKHFCPPKLAGEFISSLSSDAFHAFATVRFSASADFVVRVRDEVTHLQVRNTEGLNVCKMLVDCSRVAPILEGAPNLRHALVWVMIRKTGLNAAKKSLADLQLLLKSNVSAEAIADAVEVNEVAQLLSQLQSGGACDGGGDGYDSDITLKGKKRRTVERKEKQPKGAAKKNRDNVLAAIKLLRSKKLQLEVPSVNERDTFLKYNMIAKALLDVPIRPRQ